MVRYYDVTSDRELHPLDGATYPLHRFPDMENITKATKITTPTTLGVSPVVAVTGSTSTAAGLRVASVGVSEYGRPYAFVLRAGSGVLEKYLLNGSVAVRDATFNPTTTIFQASGPLNCLLVEEAANIVLMHHASSASASCILAFYNLTTGALVHSEARTASGVGPTAVSEYANHKRFIIFGTGPVSTEPAYITQYTLSGTPGVVTPSAPLNSTITGANRIIRSGSKILNTSNDYIGVGSGSNIVTFRYSSATHSFVTSSLRAAVGAVYSGISYPSQPDRVYFSYQPSSTLNRLFYTISTNTWSTAVNTGIAPSNVEFNPYDPSVTLSMRRDTGQCFYSSDPLLVTSTSAGTTAIGANSQGSAQLAGQGRRCWTKTHWYSCGSFTAAEGDNRLPINCGAYTLASTKIKIPLEPTPAKGYIVTTEFRPKYLYFVEIT